ncbi:MAG: flagellar hook-associated protein FlgK [Caldimicrobium sp.]
MAGLSSALNIAKNALLNFQLATSVISHNVANVNNPSYSRQKAIETTYPPSPSPVGSIGSGSRIEKIIRYFDSFLERNLNLKKTDYGLFSASEAGLNILESLFNETQDSGLSKILREFWNAWQNLANYPENLSARTQVVEYGKLISEALSTKFQGMQDLENQIGLKLKEMVDNINRLSSQIAELNLQIIARESGGKTANDLRDQRDRLVGELSQLASIQYFETKEGAYNIILGKGFNLVNLGYSWKLQISGKDVYWVGSQGERVPLTSKEIPSGELGGWLKLLEQLSDSYNYEYVSGNNTMYLGGRLLGESDKFSELGIFSGAITFVGKDHFGKEISGTFNINTGNETLRDFLDAIERAYSYTVKAYLKDGRLYVEDAFRGPGKLEFSITSAPSVINFGSFDDPAYQRRVEELNLAGKLKLFGEELIKAVNELHTQGVGLEFFTKELEGAYAVNQYIKELPYYLELNRAGFFFLWVKDESGKINPVKVDLNLHDDSKLEDLANTINQALSQAGYNTSDANFDIRAIVRSGKLVFQAREGISFAFSNDTSGILLSTGINLFFLGKDPADFQVNPLLVQKPELLAAGKMDVSALGTRRPLFGVFRSKDPVTLSNTFQVNTLYLRPYDDQGKVYSYPPQAIYEGTYSGATLTGALTITFKDANGNNLNSITIPSGTKISDLSQLLDGSQGIKATLEDSIVRLELVPNTAPSGAVWFEVTEGASGVNSLIKWNNQVKAYAISINPSGSPDPDSLGKILNKLNRLPFFRAYVDEFGHAILRLEPNQTKVYGFELGESLEGGADPASITDSLLTYFKEQNMAIPSFRWDGSEYRFLSGLEPMIKSQIYIGDANVTPSAPTTYRVRFFDTNGHEVGVASVSGAGTLAGLINNFDTVAGLKAKILGDKFYIWLDTTESGSPPSASYFTIEIADDGNSLYEGAWGLIRTNTGAIGLKAGEISAYLFDEKGNPIDTLQDSFGVVDPFRIELKTHQSLFQILQKINGQENVQWALSSRLDKSGNLIVETTGLYHTKSFILEDIKPAIRGNILDLNSLKYDKNTNSYYYLSDYIGIGTTTFSAQTIRITLLDEEGNPISGASVDINLSSPSIDELSEILDAIKTSVIGGTNYFEAGLDSSGKIYIKLKNFTYGSPPKKVLGFKLETITPPTDDNDFTSFLHSKLAIKNSKNEGLLHNLTPYELKRGDNRIAQAIADSATNTREALNLSTLENYYASMVGEVGTTTKAVRENKTFLDDLLRQLQTIKDSISGVSLDEEMANLIKYQQAFTSTAKILSTVEDMFDALINAKR